MFPDTDLSEIFSDTEEDPFKIILSKMINEKEQQKTYLKNSTSCLAADTSPTQSVPKH